MRLVMILKCDVALIAVLTVFVASKTQEKTLVNNFFDKKR